MGRRLIRAIAMLVAAWAWAGSVTAQEPTAAEPLSAEEIERDIETFRMLHGLKLTGSQATELAKGIAAFAAERRQIRAIREHPTVRAAMMTIRAAVAAGEPVTEEMRRQVNAARAAAAKEMGLAEPPDDSLWDSAHRTASQLLGLLLPEQQAYLAAPDLEGTTQWVSDSLRERRHAPPAEWARWRDEFCAQIARDRPGGERLAPALRAFLDRARGLTPDQYYEQEEALRAELRELLIPDLPADQLAERATDRLTGWLVEIPRLPLCLEEYAALQAE